MCFFFFFQAEDGIRDWSVTGVQTCALPILVVSYEQLLENTPQVLTTLQDFLQTQAPFTEEYRVLKTTGMKGVGDSKGNIKAGKIVRSQRQLTQSFSAELVEQAKQAHSDCQTALVELCQSVGTGNK